MREVSPLIVPRFPKLTKDNARSGFLSRAQFDALYSYLPEAIKDFVLFLYLLGWRRGAVASLERSDVRGGKIFLRGVISKNGKPYYVPALGELAELIKRRKEARLVETPQGIVLSNLVFHRGGEAILEFRKAWVSACKKAGCPGTIVHDLRRSAARNLIRSGVDKDTVKMVGGWKGDSMLTRYNIIGEEDLEDAMQKLTVYSKAESQKVVTTEASR
jgi:integrase